MSQDQINLIKHSLIEKLSKHYQEFMHLFANLPVQQENAKLAIQHFDTGILWAREAVLNASIQTNNIAVGEPNPNSLPNDPREGSSEAPGEPNPATPDPNKKGE